MQTKYILRYETGDTQEFASLDALASFVASQSDCIFRHADEDFLPEALDTYIADNGLSAFEAAPLTWINLKQVVTDYALDEVERLRACRLYPDAPYRLLGSELILTGRCSHAS